MKKILLHICCAPCSASAVKLLKEEYKISFFWHNPNVYDKTEYENRKISAVRYCVSSGFDFFEESQFEYDYENWKKFFLEQCSLCYELRLEKTALFAKENNFDFFTTSLLSSPHQNHEVIKTLAQEISKKVGIEFLYEDFRPYFYEEKNVLKRENYYMQKYCACAKSYRERFKNV
ncbi:MAG: epoxyqueuosine reductase QueH [Elusimicrobiota bacterium]|jgi:predicted adenine nucleotide alpha hydrolase (AANH) superfamily ATPase|nr:epoxyqueuosine reductase QueH [Elusimicrobiota bacterium]